MDRPQDWYKTKELAEDYQIFQKSYMSPSRYLCLQLADRKMGTAPSRILDLGCGTGAAIPVLQELFPGTAIVGLDIEPKMLEIARMQHTDSNVMFLEGSSQKLPDNIGHFDFIFSFSSFRLWDSPVCCLKEIQNHLSNNGMAYIADLRKDISSQTQFEALKNASNFKMLVEEQMISAYKIDEVEFFLDKGGIQNYSLYSQPFNILFQNRSQKKLISAKMVESNTDSSELIANKNLHSMLFHLFIYPENHE